MVFSLLIAFCLNAPSRVYFIGIFLSTTVIILTISAFVRNEYLLLAFIIKAHIVHFVFCLFLPPVRQNESNGNGKYYDKQCLLHNHSFLYVYYKNLCKNIIKNITKRIKPHPHARFDISLSKLDNSVAFFDLLPS